MVPVHLFCRCGVPPFDGEMTQKELRLSLIHPARHYEVHYVTKIIYWPIAWSTLLGKLFQFGPHQEFFLSGVSCLFYALTIFYSCFFTAERAKVMPCQTLWCSTDQMRSTLCVIVWSWSSVANMALMVSQTLWSQHSFLKVQCAFVGTTRMALPSLAKSVYLACSLFQTIIYLFFFNLAELFYSDSLLRFRLCLYVRALGWKENCQDLPPGLARRRPLDELSDLWDLHAVLPAPWPCCVTPTPSPHAISAAPKA